MNSDKELFADLTRKVSEQVTLSRVEQEKWIEFLLKLARGRDSFKSISEQLGSILGDITEWNIKNGDISFNLNGLTVPLNEIFADTYTIPTHSGDTVTRINAFVMNGTTAYIRGAGYENGGDGG